MGDTHNHKEYTNYFQNDIAIIRVIEYNNYYYIHMEVSLWNLCLREKLPTNGEFPKDELQFFALKTE